MRVGGRCSVSAASRSGDGGASPVLAGLIPNSKIPAVDPTALQGNFELFLSPAHLNA